MHACSQCACDWTEQHTLTHEPLLYAKPPRSISPSRSGCTASSFAPRMRTKMCRYAQIRIHKHANTQTHDMHAEHGTITETSESASSVRVALAAGAHQWRGVQLQQRHVGARSEHPGVRSRPLSVPDSGEEAVEQLLPAAHGSRENTRARGTGRRVLARILFLHQGLVGPPVHVVLAVPRVC